ncbi:MAG: CPBP family intramembrane metalloprotease [Phycisphaerales bacterium]|nr:CPBP family intramembrane metalloprotease [Phycisphaerales bacterium]
MDTDDYSPTPPADPPREETEPGHDDPSLAGTASALPDRPWLEVGVVLMIGVIPHTVSSVVDALSPPEQTTTWTYSFTAESLMHTAWSASIIAAVLWVMRQSEDPWSSFGFRKFRPVKDTVMGVGLWILAWVGYVVVSEPLAVVLWNMGFDWSDESIWENGVLSRPEHALDIPMIIVHSLFNAFSEQLVITAYLVSRLRRLAGGPAPAILIAATLFATYHMYQDIWGVVNAAIFGLLFTSLFVVTRRIWPCFVAHSLADIVPYMLTLFEA